MTSIIRRLQAWQHERNVRHDAYQTQRVLSLRNELTDLTTSLAYVMAQPGGARDEFHGAILADRYATVFRQLQRESSRPSKIKITPVSVIAPAAPV